MKSYKGSTDHIFSRYFPVPETLRALDVVTTENFPLGAVLPEVRSTRRYVLYKGGAIHSVDQRLAQRYMDARYSAQKAEAERLIAEGVNGMDAWNKIWTEDAIVVEV